MNRDREYNRMMREKKAEERYQKMRNIEPTWSLAPYEDTPKLRGQLSNGNNGYLSGGRNVKTNTRKGHASYRHKGAYGPENNYSVHDGTQVEDMRQQVEEWKNDI